MCCYEIYKFYQVGNKKWLGTIKYRPLSQSLQKQTQGKDLSFNKTLSILIQIESYLFEVSKTVRSQKSKELDYLNLIILISNSNKE